MLSISLIKSSAAAVSYYEKDDYYAANGGDPDAQGQWYGKGADRLGLAGGVEREQFKKVLEGELPNGRQLGTIREGKNEHRPGWDLTFSAPKSVSVLAEVGGDERLLAAHDEAVRTALDYVEENAAANRQRGFLGFNVRQADNLVAALFQHDTSRNQDPQLHTHAVVANVTQRADGKWVSFHGDRLYTHKMAAGNVYRAALAESVQKLGYEIEKTDRDGRFELTAVPDNVAEKMSSRRAEIEAALQQRGLDGAEASAQAAVMTRGKKEVVARAELLPGWQAQAQALGFDAPAAVAAAREAGDRTPQGPFNVGRAVRQAADRLADREAVFIRPELVRWALAESMGRASRADIERAIEAASRSGEVVGTLLDQERAWTTPAAQERERRYLENLANTQGAVTPIMGASQAREALAGRELGEGQRDALQLLLTTSDRFVGVLGRPGVGKTYMMKHGRELIEASGYSIVGMAANSEAARQLQKDAGIESSTIHRHLARANATISKIGKAAPAAAEALREVYAKQVWAVDEASQLDSPLMRRISYAADRLGARVVLIGDTQQLAAIGAGKPFDLMLKAGMKHVEVDEIRRQKVAHHVDAVRAAIKGDSAKAMNLLGNETLQIENKQARMSAIVDAWSRAPADARPLVLTAKNADKTWMNDRMRDQLRAEGRLQGEDIAPQLFKVGLQRADLKHAEVYAPGDVVRFGKGAKSLGIEGGEYLTVTNADRRSNLVTLSRTGHDGKVESITWNPSQVAGSAKQGVELYRPRDEATIAPGERIVWARNSSELGLNNGAPLTVVSISGSKMTVRTDAGETREIDTAQHQGRHWEHSYASSLYKAQGKTDSAVLVNAESDAGELFSQKAFLVGISRQQHELKLYTDNAKAFLENLQRHSGEKTSSTESHQTSRFKIAADWMERANHAFANIVRPPADDKTPEQDRVRQQLDR